MAPLIGKLEVDAIVHKNSSVADRQPDGGQLEYGELAINYSAVSPFLSIKLSDGSVRTLKFYAAGDKQVVITYQGVVNAALSQPPANPSPGQIYINTGTGTPQAGWGLSGTVSAGQGFLWDGTGWNVLGGSGGGSGSSYTLPVASSGTLGGVRIGAYLTIDPQGVVNVQIPAATTTASGLLSAVDKLKLDGIESGATGSTQSDWNQNNSTAGDYIKNKPTLPTVPGVATSTSDGLMAAADKSKLDGLTTGGGGGTAVQSDWAETASTSDAFIRNKPTIPPAPGSASTTSSGLMSAADKIKIDSVASGAEVNVQADWNQTSSADDSFIRNKPTIPVVPGVATTSANGLMSSTDKTKLDGIPAGGGTGGGTTQIQANWDETSTASLAFIQNKPVIPQIPYVATTSSDGLMSSGDKSKLNGIASGAEVNVQADWNQTNSGDDAFIKNKPGTGSTTAPGMVQLADAAAIGAGTPGRVVDAAQLKAATPTVTTSQAGFMAAADKTKLDAIASQATRNVGKLVPAAPLVGAQFDGSADVGWSINDASTTAKGIVQLATTADVTNGATNRAVTANLLKDRTQAASLASAGIVQLSENYKVLVPSQTEAVTPRALNQVYVTAESNRRRKIDIDSALGSEFTLPTNGLTFVGVVPQGVTKILFDMPNMGDGTHYDIYNDSGVILDVIVLGKGFIHRSVSGWTEATAAKPAKLQVNGVLNVWITDPNGMIFSRGLT